jgi:hypothetical protein
VATGGLIDTDLELQIRSGDNGIDTSGTTVFDNVYITNAVYANRYPS